MVDFVRATKKTSKTPLLDKLQLSIKNKSKLINLDNFLAIDTETTGLSLHHGCRAFAICTCDQDGDTNYWETSVNPKNREVRWNRNLLRSIKDYIDSFPSLFFFHASFDIQALCYIDKEFEEIVWSKEIHDTQIMAHIYDSKGPKGLKELSILHLDIDDSDEDELDETVKRLHRKLRDSDWDIARKGHKHFPGAKGKFHKMDFWLPRAYAAKFRHDLTDAEYAQLHDCCEKYGTKDGLRTAGLAHVLGNYINSDEQSRKAYWVNQEVIPAIIEMESNGIFLLPGKFEAELEEFNNQAQGLRKSLTIMAGDPEFNPDSPNQLNDLLYNKFKYPTEGVKQNATGFSTDKATLPFLLTKRDKVTFQAYRFVDTLINYRAINSAVKYLKSYQRFQLDHHLYPNLNQCGTSTTRLSSRDPNGQNVSKGKENENLLDEDGNPVIEYSLRRVFGPAKGRKWYAIDYDQLQIRIFAFLSQEPTLVKAILEGKDFHSTVAQDLHNTKEPTKAQRKQAKYINFGIIFGAGEKRVAELAGDPTAYKKYRKMYPNVASYITSTSAIVRRDGFIRTASGYPLTVAKNKPYTGVNYEVQGTEGDIVKLALGRIFKYLKKYHPEVKMLLQVHDEIIFDAPEDYNFPVDELCTIMEECGAYFGIPCKAKPEVILTNWAEGKSVERFTQAV